MYFGWYFIFAVDGGGLDVHCVMVAEREKETIRWKKMKKMNLFLKVLLNLCTTNSVLLEDQVGRSIHDGIAD